MSDYNLKIEAASNADQIYPSDAEWIVGARFPDGDFAPIVGFATETEARLHVQLLDRIMKNVSKSLEIDWFDMLVHASHAVLDIK